MMLRPLKNLMRDLSAFLQVATRILVAWEWSHFVRPDGFGRLTQLDERGDLMKQWQYSQALLPVKPGTDSQRLVISVDGVEQETIPIASDATAVEFWVGPAGATVRLSLDYLDDAGNDSENFEFEFQVTDQTAPDSPDGFGALTQIGERDVPDPPTDSEDGGETPTDETPTDETPTDETPADETPADDATAV